MFRLLISFNNKTKNITIMKLLYISLLVLISLVAGYLFLNDFSFDNKSFSNYLINTLFIILLTSLAVIGVALLLNRKKDKEKNIMTIRQYYQYKK